MTETSSSAVSARYTGLKGPLFRLAIVNGLLTILTLGIYRFWAKTRVRKFIWSSIDLGGDRPEYTGTGLEKFLGFLVAVVVLAVYLGLIQILLFYFGLYYVVAPKTETEMIMQVAVFYISLFAVLPLILFARYRSRRYLMARTRFLGIRFGMEKPAWGYVWRALAHGALTVVTLGILLPRQTFWLEKYKTDRSWYGDQRFVQGGRWTGLYRAMRHLFIGAALLFVAAPAIAIVMAAQGKTGETAAFAAIPVALIGFNWALFGYLYYRVHSFRYLTAHKSLVGAMAFRAEPRTGRIIGIYLLGVLIIGAIVGVAFAVAFGVAAATIASAGSTGAMPDILGVVVMALFYLGVLTLAGALILVFIVQPVLAHIVGTLTIFNPEALAEVRQRAYDAGADAEGFADALDVGGAI
ncbi:MAG TPA: DUF898 family protein [Albidovulum sp.]|uniref:DUF898 family protein n=1 Tax=Albidovulum sp. TaxID=1872424 RepID=UPI002D13F0B4|nr:DUF898 family protein [Albidovulum sp.]